MITNPCNEIDTLVEQYNKCLGDILDKHAPVIEKSLSVKPKQPWMNDAIREQKRKRHTLERKWRKSKSPNDYQQFKIQRTATNKLIVSTKTKYLSEMISEKETDQKELFKSVKSLLHAEKEVTYPEHHSKQELAEKFSDYFINKIQKIRDNFPSSGDHTTYESCDKPIPTFRTFALLSQEEVYKFIMKSPTKSSNLDPIPTDLLKKCIQSLLPPIKKIINKSLDQGYVPSSFKNARISDLFQTYPLFQSL